MHRLIDTDGIIHLQGHDARITLCGLAPARDLPPTREPATCAACARLYCQIKNSPWHDLDPAALTDATYAAVETDAP